MKNESLSLVRRLFVAAAAFALSLGLSAETYTWKSTASGNWEDAANWNPSTGYPSAADDVAIVPLMTDDTTVTVTVNDPLKIASLSVGSQNQQLAGKVAVEFKTGLATNEVTGNVSVTSGGILTHFGPNDTITQRLALKVGGDMTVAAGGAVDVITKGYTDNHGPGCKRCYPTYAGTTDTYVSSEASRGRVYGSIRKPLDYGSATRDGGSTKDTPGSGSVYLDVAGTLTVNGTMTASANHGSKLSAWVGAAGSLYLKCSSLLGTGVIESRGGQGSNSGYSGSSGGRIAVYQSTATSLGFTGTLRTGRSGVVKATCGTIYLEYAGDTAGEGTLIIDNDGTLRDYSTDIDPNVADASEPFGNVIVRNGGRLRIVNGATLKVTKGLSVDSKSRLVASAGHAIEFVGDEDCTVIGGSYMTLESLICTNAPGKTIKFGTTGADKWTIGAGKKLILKGTSANKIKLRSTTNGTRWQMCVNHLAALVDVAYVDVQDADASSGASVVAAHSTEGSNNLYWGFTPQAAPGETITWTGEKSTDWENAKNWSPDRTPTEDDVIVIPSVSSAKYPVVPASTYRFNKITVQSGASLTWKGCTTTITNDLVVAGSMVFTAGEPLYVYGNVTVTGSVTPASGTIYVVGSGDQTLDFGDTTLFKIQFDKPSGNVSFGTHGFTATQFNCQATTAIAFTFHAGATYTIPQLLVNGLSGQDRLVTLRSSAEGEKWNLATTAAGQNVVGVNVSDCDATGGDLIYAGTLSRATNCLGWDVVSDVASWLGGSGSFTDPAKWSSGSVPGADTLVTISAGDGVSLTVTQAANAPLTVKQLTVYAGTGGKATFEVNSPLTIKNNIELRSGGNLELNCFNEGGDAPNVVTGDVHIASGGVLSHTGPNDTEVKKLHIRVLGRMTIDAGGAVDVGSKGYTEKHGIGWTRCFPFHGGTGSDYANSGTYANKYCYGCIRKPTEYGAGPGAGEKKYGGGVAMLEVPGTLCVNGEICSRSKDVTTGSPISSGAGGSIYVRCGTLTGSGAIDARGGYCSGGQGTFGGSGGRIAVYTTDAPVRSAFTGKISTANPKNCVACGTVYLQDPSDEDGLGTLIVDNNNVSISYVTDFNSYVTDACQPFGSVVVTNCGQLKLSGTTRLAVTKGIFLSANANIKSDATATIEFVGTNDATIVNAKRIAFPNLICTNVAKTIRFGSGANEVLAIPNTGRFVMSGKDAAHTVNLWPTTAGGTWSVTVGNDTVKDVLYASVSNSTASANITAIDSQDLGGNTLWSFSSVIHPGDVITWTGATSTDWKEGKNWDPAREPVDTDDIRIAVATSGNYPVLPSGNYSFNKLTVASGAELTLGGNMSVTNALRVAGTLVFSGSETLTLQGAADFSGGAVTRAHENVLVSGEGSQTCDFGGCRFNKITVSKPSGDLSFGGSGFETATFNCRATAAIALTFAAGNTYTINGLYLNGVSGDQRLVTLQSSEPGSAWHLVATSSQGVAGVTVSDSDASGGATVYGGSTSAAAGTNVNWDFERDVAAWIGGATGDFTDAANWANGKVPTNTTHVTVRVGDGETVAVTIPSGHPTTLASLTLGAGDGGSALLTAKSPLTVAADVTLDARGTLALDCYANDGVAPNVVSNNVVIKSGGKLTHSGPASTENAKLHLAVLGDLTVEAGGSVDVSDMGYVSQSGPGAGHFLGGAAHAGYGHKDNDGNHPSPYGSILKPFTWGAATCTDTDGGGGAMHLVITGTLRVDGSVLAEGKGNGTYGNAGGSIWIECAELVGAGLISASEAANWASSDYASSGGHVAVYQLEGRSFDAFPIAQIKATNKGGVAAGTVYLESADKREGTHLYVMGGTNAAREYTRVPMTDDGDALKIYRNVNLIIGPNAWVEVPSKLHACFRDIEIQATSSKLYVNGGTLDVRSYRHLNGKNWLGTVEYGGTTLNPGKINWVGGVGGLCVIIR